MLKAARVFFTNVPVKQRAIITLGDFGDFYAASFHAKKPGAKSDMRWEVEECNKALTELDALDAGSKYFIEGNHEYRLSRYLSEKAPELYSMMSIPELFKLKDRGWKFIPYKRSLQVGKLRFTHDLERAGVNAHRQAIVDSGMHNIIIGHTHRLGYEVVGSVDGVPHLGHGVGWLGGYDDIDYRHRDRALRDWAHAFSVAVVEPGGDGFVQPVPLVGRKCWVAGQVVRL